MSKLMNVARLFVAVMVIGFCASAVMAKDANDPNKPKHKMREPQRPMRDRTEMRLEEMTKRLNLTKEQQEAIKPIIQDEHKQIEAVMKDETLSREQKHPKMQEIRKATMAKIDAQLTPEQLEKIKKEREMMKERRAEMREKGQQRRAEHKKPAAPDSNSKK
jgi:Spy/CpxP family protein refolding chaperone